MKNTLYILGDLIHHLQRERGCSAMFLCSGGDNYAHSLATQQKLTDDAFNVCREEWDNWAAVKLVKPKNLDKIKDILDKKEDLNTRRSKLLIKELTASQSIDFFTDDLISPLLLESIEVALYMDGANPTLVSAFNAFLQWKERIGLERAIGVRGFVGEGFQDQEFFDRLLYLLVEQNNYQNTFMALANDEQKSIVQDVLDSDLFQKLDKMHDLLNQHLESDSIFNMTPEAWFNLISAKIDALQKILYQLISTLIEKNAVKKTIKPVLSPSLYANTAFAKHALLIDSLQIFSGLPTNTLQSLMNHAQIREYEKGKLLFLEGEQAHRFYIILSGWIKIFKGTVNGDEAILQMLSSGDSIMETAVYLNLRFPVSAQVAENATVLSLPAPVVREQVKNNNKLAVNLLSSMCYRSQNLIRQIEVARLKSVDERIGWFLLKLTLDQGNKSRQIQLPYDKSIIASYLDMKRETFSRALKRLKQKGYIIENDMITLPKPTSLCEFCDHSLADICPHHKSKDCPNPQFSSEDDIKTA